MLFEEISEFPDESSALGGGHAVPRSLLESLACSFYCAIDIFAISFCHLGENLARSGIVCGESLAGRGFDPSSVNQHLSWFIDELRDLRMNLRRNCDAHRSSLVNMDLQGRIKPGEIRN